MAISEARTKIFLSGPFQIVCVDGNDVTPRGAKAKALLALVLLSENAIRSRTWLQDRLWSASSQQQGASSLRKELSVLKKEFSRHNLTFLNIDRETVSINLQEVEVDVFEERQLSERAELLEGLDVADVEFEDWLAVERQAYWGLAEIDEELAPQWSKPLGKWSRQRPSIVLEPMEEVGVQPEVSVVARSIHDELMFLLGNLSDVIELRDARRQTEPIDGYILSGSVVGAEGLRVAAQLTSSEDRSCLWNERFRFRPGDQFNAVEEIAIQVVEALQLRLRDGHWSEIWSSRNTVVEAWTAFQKGRIQEGHTTYEGLQHAIRHYETCLKHDPKYLPAKVAIGFCHLDLIRLGMDPSPERTLIAIEEKCEDLSEAFSDDPYFVALQAFFLCAKGNTEEACAVMRSALDRFQYSPDVLGYYAGLLGYNDQLEEEISICRQAIALTPHPPIWIEANLALALALNGDKSAWRHAHNVLNVDTGNVRAHVVLCAASVQARNMTLAHRHARRILEIQPSFQSENWAWNVCFKNPDHYRRMVDLLSQAGL